MYSIVGIATYVYVYVFQHETDVHMYVHTCMLTGHEKHGVQCTCAHKI